VAWLVRLVLLAAAGLIVAGGAEATTQPAAPVPFSSNGCSGFREAKFFSCCFVHDLAFWAGGTWADRRAADLSLRRCIKDISHNFVIADVAYSLTRLGIVPGTFMNDGWGRAWRGQKRTRFQALTPDQRLQVDTERRRVCQSLILNPQTGNYRVDDTREIRANQAREICGGVNPPGLGRHPTPLDAA